MRSRPSWVKPGWGIAAVVVVTAGLGGSNLLRDSSPEPSGEPPPAPAARIAPMALITSSGHDLVAGDERFQVWGFNYGIGDRYPILDYFEAPTARRQTRVFNDMREARSLGANTLRIYLEIGSFMRNANEPRPAALRAYRELLAEAQRLGLYIDVTGNLVWTKPPRWYDALDERARWRVQARFWRAVAEEGHRSRAVLAYELTSEPSITDSESWYSGQFGGYTFIQNIVRDIDGRDPQRLARQWVRKMRAAIRTHDRRHLIGIGFLPACGGAFAHEELADLLDILLVHVYPREGDSGESVDTVCDFSDHGLPVVLGETSPLFTQSWGEFLLDSRREVDGYLYFYDGRRPGELTGDALAEVFLRAALKQFLKLQDDLVGPPPGSNEQAGGP